MSGRWALVAVMGLVLLAAAAGASTFYLSNSGKLAKAGAEITTLIKPSNVSELFTEGPLPRLRFDVGFRSVQKLESKRTEAIELGLLFTNADDFVPADIVADGRVIPVSIRLKGDGLDHLSAEKPSYRVKVKGNGQIMGMRRFSIQSPATRRFLQEWAFLENMRSEGVLTPRYDFLEVTFNGEDRGIYAIEEHFSNEMLESQQRREGVIIRFDESGFWAWQLQRGRVSGDVNNTFSLIAPVDEKAVLVDAFRDSRISKSQALSDQRDAAIGLLRGYIEGELSASEVFDVELMGRFAAIIDLWDAPHVSLWNNRRFYYNPITARLEPIAFDAEPEMDVTREFQALLRLDLRSDPEITAAYVGNLARISAVDYVERLEQSFGAKLEWYRDILNDEFGDISAPWKRLRERHRLIRDSLQPVVPALAFIESIPSADAYSRASELTITVRNVLTLPIEILGFQIGSDRFVTAAEAFNPQNSSSPATLGESTVILPPDLDDTAPRFAKFQIEGAQIPDESPDDSSASAQILTRLVGAEHISETDLQPYPSTLLSPLIPPPPSISEALANHPFLTQGTEDDVLFVQPGEWQVSGDLVLPENTKLQAGPGTTLLFDPGAAIIARGALLFTGLPDALIELKPKDKSWAGIAVLQASSRSQWDHVSVQGTSAINRNGWILTGGITFYESSVSLNDCSITESTAEDALNIVRAEFEISRCQFNRIASDAFDGDFVSGSITDSAFVDVGGDAIDFAGSKVRLENVTTLRIADKGLSVGEMSNVTVIDFRASNVGIGIASKDQSTTRGVRVSIDSAANVGLAAYVKKPEFGPATMDMREVTFSDTPTETLVQTDSWIRIDGRRFGGSDLDVKALYDLGVLGN